MSKFKKHLLAGLLTVGALGLLGGIIRAITVYPQAAAGVVVIGGLVGIVLYAGYQIYMVIYESL